MRKEYKIGDVANLLGISTETIRNYEKQGLISPKKSESSGYRYYTTWDINCLISIMIYKGYNCSMSDISELLNMENTRDLIIEKITEKEKEIEDILIANINTLKGMRIYKENLNRAMEIKSTDDYKLEYSPELFRLDMQTNYELKDDELVNILTKQWIKKIPFLYPGALFNIDDVENNINYFSYGLSIDKNYAEYLKIDLNEHVKYYESSLCFYTTVRSYYNNIFSADMLKPALSKLKSLGLKPKGYILTRLILTGKYIKRVNQINDNYTNLHEVWIPIEKF